MLYRGFSTFHALVASTASLYLLLLSDLFSEDYHDELIINRTSSVSETVLGVSQCRSLLFCYHNLFFAPLVSPCKMFIICILSWLLVTLHLASSNKRKMVFLLFHRFGIIRIVLGDALLGISQWFNWIHMIWSGCWLESIIETKANMLYSILIKNLASPTPGKQWIKLYPNPRHEN